MATTPLVLTGRTTASRPAVASVPESGERASTRRRPGVLVVEDQEDTRELLTWAMRAAGWRADALTNGFGILAKVLAFEPDVVVMDLHMPGVDGVDATRQLKTDPRTAGIPVVACTAFVSDYSAGTLRASGFDLVIRKPCTAEEVREALERIVAKSGETG